MKNFTKTVVLLLSIYFVQLQAQYVPAINSENKMADAKRWVDQTYRQLSLDERLGQLFIIALYTNKDEQHINEVRDVVLKEKIGGLILMQDDAIREVNLVNEFQHASKVPLLIGMDAEWGLYQRIPSAYKFPWAITLGAIQDKQRIYEMAQKIAEDAKRMGVNWDFAPVVDVNTNPNNPIIGNRSFGSDVRNVTSSALAYSQGLQDAQVLAAIKHFPGHGDTDTDSHLDLPVVSHRLSRLNQIEIAPFKNLMNKGIGGVMVAHLYVPALEPQKGIPASISKNIVTGLLKEKLGYKGLIITDALNMGAVANKYEAGELDALAFAAGNDIMLFSQNVAKGKRLIQQKINEGTISQRRLEESVKKILLTKYLLGLTNLKPISTENINHDLNNFTHRDLVRNLYSSALTLIKDKKDLLPLNCKKTYYYVPLEESDFQRFNDQLNLSTTVIRKKVSELSEIPKGSPIIIGLHKDNSTAYKSFKISAQSQSIISSLAKDHDIILTLFGSPYGLKDVNISDIPTILVAYENNDDSMFATAEAMVGKTDITGRLPVLVNDVLPYGTGKNLYKKANDSTAHNAIPIAKILFK